MVWLQLLNKKSVVLDCEIIYIYIFLLPIRNASLMEQRSSSDAHPGSLLKPWRFWFISVNPRFKSQPEHRPSLGSRSFSQSHQLHYDISVVISNLTITNSFRVLSTIPNTIHPNLGYFVSEVTSEVVHWINNKLPVLYETRTFITIFTKARDWSAPHSLPNQSRVL